MFYAKILNKELKKQLITNILSERKVKENLPFPLTTIEDKEEMKIYESIIKSYKILGEQYYRSRQDFLKSIYVDNGKLVFHINDDCYRTTCAGSHSESDPFYNSNLITKNYEIGDDKYQKEIIDLKTRFKKNNDDVIYELDLSFISIDKFNSLFSVDGCKEDIIAFIKELQRHLEEKPLEENKFEQEDDFYSYRRVFRDNGKDLKISQMNGIFEDLNIGDYIIGTDNEKYEVLNIEIENHTKEKYGYDYINVVTVKKIK